MKDRLLTFIDALRDAGLPITVGEALDAMHAVGIIGIAPQAFREALAAALVKDEADRPEFDAVFARFFAAPGRKRGKGDRPHPSEEGHGRGTGKTGAVPAAGERPQRRTEQPAQRRALEPRAEPRQHEREHAHGRRLARARTLLHMPFDEMSPADIEACEALVAELAQRFRTRLSRRQRAAQRGRLDIRRTVRRSISTGGVPIHPAFRHRRPGRPDLVALCDLSHSVATASKFLLALLAPASAFFRRVRFFAFVDHPVEVSLDAGMLVPHAPLDEYARSDFGRVLTAFWELSEPLLTRNSIVLILGDARNNRRPSRGDLLGRLRSTVRQVIWLNPEPPARWNTGDSTMAAYQRHCDALLAAGNIHELDVALRRTFRGM